VNGGTRLFVTTLQDSSVMDLISAGLKAGTTD